MTQERISTSQVMTVIALIRITIALVISPALNNPDLKQDAWLVSLLGSLMNIPFIWVLNRLWQRFPRQTFVEVAETVLGKALGKLFTVLYLLYLLLLASQNLRLVGEFFVSSFLPRTPIIVIIGMVAFLSTWAARAGVEVIGRASQVVFPLVVGSILVIIVLLLKDMQFSALLPPEFVTSGPVPHLKGTFTEVARYLEFAVLGMLVPFVNERRGLLRAMVLAQVWQGVILAMMSATVTATIGQAAVRLYFPFYNSVQLVSVADFLERVDAILLSVWLLGMFLRIALILWAASLGAAQWLGLKEYRPLVIPLAGIAMTYALAQAESFSELRGYARSETIAPFMFTFGWVIPVLVLAVAAIRGVRGDRDAAAARGHP